MSDDLSELAARLKSKYSRKPEQARQDPFSESAGEDEEPVQVSVKKSGDAEVKVSVEKEQFVPEKKREMPSIPEEELSNPDEEIKLPDPIVEEEPHLQSPAAEKPLPSNPSIPEEEQVSQSAPMKSIEEKIMPKKSSKTKLLMVAAIGVVLIIAAIIVIFVL